MTIYRGPWAPAFIRGGSGEEPPASTLYWWTFDGEGAVLPYNVTAGDANYPIEYNGHNGTSADSALFAPSVIDAGGQFSNNIGVIGGMFGYNPI